MRLSPSRAPLLALAFLVPACHRGALAPPSSDLDEVLHAVAACPVTLSDEQLDDLRSYAVCTLPAAVARLVRNDYADDELRLPDWGALRRHAGALPRATFEAQLRRFVDPGGFLRGYLSLDGDPGLLRPDPVLAPDVGVPFAPGPPPATESYLASASPARLVPPPGADRPFRPRRRHELRASAVPGKPLAGVRVGVDPGHAGGAYGLFEGRHVRLSAPDAGSERALQEGDLTLRTALEARAALVAAGAEVVLTRDRPSLVHDEPLHALRPAAERLLRRIALDPGYAAVETALAPPDRLRLRSALALYAVARRSRFESLRARARALAAEDPDVVLSIHFNAAPPGARRDGPEDVVAMVRGFHDASRLYNPFHRWRALEGAFAVADFDASVHLGVLCVRAMSRRLELPVARENRYRDHLPIRDALGHPTGVDAWDGALLRYLDGVALVVEGPYVDHPGEAARLEAALAAPLGTPGTRTKRYADALASCVEEFVARWIGSEQNPFSSDP